MRAEWRMQGEGLRLDWWGPPRAITIMSAGAGARPSDIRPPCADRLNSPPRADVATDGRREGLLFSQTKTCRSGYVTPPLGRLAEIFNPWRRPISRTDDINPG